jgi:hypothetical protein
MRHSDGVILMIEVFLKLSVSRHLSEIIHSSWMCHVLGMRGGYNWRRFKSLQFQSCSLPTEGRAGSSIPRSVIPTICRKTLWNSPSVARTRLGSYEIFRAGWWQLKDDRFIRWKFLGRCDWRDTFRPLSLSKPLPDKVSKISKNEVSVLAIFDRIYFSKNYYEEKRVHHFRKSVYPQTENINLTTTVSLKTNFIQMSTRLDGTVLFGVHSGRGLRARNLWASLRVQVHAVLGRKILRHQS